jgi:hypothetical protein
MAVCVDGTALPGQFSEEAHITWEVLHQAALALRDPELVRLCEHATVQADRRIDQAAPQALIVRS